MTVSPRAQVLDSGEFVAHEYAGELFEGRVFDTDTVDDMYRAATRLVNDRLRAYWERYGYLLLGVGRDTYHRLTVDADAETHVGTVMIPAVDESRMVWEAVVARISADDIEEEARRG